MGNPEMNNPSPVSVLAGDLAKGWDATERLPARVGNYSNLKEKTEEFTEWARDGGIPQFNRADQKLFRKLENCGQYLIFRNFLYSGRSRLIGGCSCKEHLLCAYCAARRGVKFSVAYKEKFDAIKKDHPDYELVLITFTVANGPSLTERYLHLAGAMRRILKRRTDALAGKRTQSSISCLTGGVFAYEFKRGSGSGDWHPHIHMLALKPRNFFVDIHSIKAEWQNETKDSHVVNIEPVFNDSAFLEVFAYALKFSTLTHDDRLYAFRQLKGERLISSFGDFRGVEVPESDMDELLLTEEPWVDLLFRYRKNFGYDNGTFIDASDDLNLSPSDLKAA